MKRAAQSKKIDVIDKLLNACYQHNKDALFVMSLMHQYEERGSLSRKQLEGLLHKARKIEEIPVGWIAAVEAIVLRMPVRQKSETPIVRDTPQSLVQEQEKLVNDILAGYPNHRQVLIYRQKLALKQELDNTEYSTLQRFHKKLVNTPPNDTL